jgi:addiction module HigA family antidote
MLNITIAIAKDIGASAPRIRDIVAGKRAITADTALRLSRYLGTSVSFWMNLQETYNLEKTKYVVATDLSNIYPYALPT